MKVILVQRFTPLVLKPHHDLFRNVPHIFIHNSKCLLNCSPAVLRRVRAGGQRWRGGAADVRGLLHAAVPERRLGLLLGQVRQERGRRGRRRGNRRQEEEEEDAAAEGSRSKL